MAFLEKNGVLPALIAAAGALMAFVALRPPPGKDGSLLLVFLFFIAVVEGCIAAAAAGTMVNARWISSVRKELLSVTPLLLLSSFLLLLLIPFLDTYPWAGRPGFWLRKDFFIGRNLAFLLLSYVTARRFASAPAGGEGAKVRAAWYLLVFVASQTLVAFDLVMSLEYPWVNALFGGYFFIEAIYGGFAVSALLCLRRGGAPPAERAAQAARMSGGGPDVCVGGGFAPNPPQQLRSTASSRKRRRSFYISRPKPQRTRLVGPRSHLARSG